MEVDSVKMFMIYKKILCLPDMDKNKSGFLNLLGNIYLMHYQRCQDINDLNHAVCLYDDALAVHDVVDNGAIRATYLSNFGISLAYRFGQLGDISDIDKSILMFEGAVQLTPDHCNIPSRLNNLGNSLFLRFLQLRNLDDINQSILMFEEAVQLTPDGDLNLSLRLKNLGNSLLLRFKQLGNLDDINKSILMFEKAVQLTPNGHPNMPLRLNNLGISLFCRFERLGNLNDRNKSVLLFELAVQLTLDGNPSKPCLNNLGNSLLSHFEKLGDLGDMNKSESVLMKEHVVQLTLGSGHPDEPCLTNLGKSLLSCFKRFGDLSDLNKSVLVFKHAVQFSPDGNPDKPSCLNNLGKSLLSHFERLGDLNDINKSVLMFEDAVQLSSDGDPNKPSRSYNLGSSLLSCFERLSNPNHPEVAISYFSSSVSSGLGSILVHFQSSSMWAQCAKLSGNQSALDAYIVALQLLPQLAWLGLPTSDHHHHHLLKAAGVVRNAVAVEQYNTAIEWLEWGHSIIWGQLLQLQNPVDDLQDKYPHLATKLQYLSKLLEGTNNCNDFQMPSITSWALCKASEKQNHELAHEQNELLKAMQTLSGFEAFMLPKTFSQPIPAACVGPVITIDVSEARCDALILPDLNDVLHTPLPNFAYLDAEDLKKSLNDILKEREALQESHQFSKKVDSNFANTEKAFEDILSHLWKHIVRPILDGMDVMVCIYLILAI